MRQAKRFFYRRCVFSQILIMLCCTVILSGWAVDIFAQPAADEMGQELRGTENDIIKSGQERPKKTPEMNLEEPQTVKIKQSSVTSRVEPVRLRLQGDAQFLETVGLRDDLITELAATDLSHNAVEQVVARYKKMLIRAGYYLVQINVLSVDQSERIVALDIDQGRFGTMTFFNKTEEHKAGTEPFTEKYFSEKQLRRRMADLSEGSVFDYNELYRSVYRINSHPDLTMDMDLDVITREDGQRSKRYADMACSVEETLPVHGSLELNNLGTESLDEWRPRLTIQHLNVSKRDDALTLNVNTSIDFSSALSAALSYNIPYYLGNGGDLTAYGGYSTIEIDEIYEARLIGVEGEGMFLGAQGSYRLKSTRTYNLAGTLGIVYRTIEDNIVFKNPVTGGVVTGGILAREVTIMPVSVGVNYTSLQPDKWGGSNFLSSRFAINVAGDDGDVSPNTSGSSGMEAMHANADSDYWIQYLQLTRFQPVFRGNDADGTASNGWLLLCNLNGQFASGELIPTEQIAIGGADTVRGYIERDVKGDTGGYMNLELRSPAMANLLPFGKIENQLQGVVFIDAGYVSNDTPEYTEEKNQTLTSGGLGLRLTVSKYAQLRVDYGVPFETTEDSDSSGRAHVRFQMQF